MNNQAQDKSSDKNPTSFDFNIESQEHTYAHKGVEKKKTFIEKLKNEKWTRVIALDDFSFVDYKLYCLKDDLIEY
jgi:hypothetical protein